MNAAQMINSGYLFFSMTLAIVLIACLLGLFIRLKKKEEPHTSFLDSLTPSLGMKKNLDLILTKLQDYVNAPNFSFYLYDPTHEQYVLKAVRQLTNDAPIAPSYSGLVPYGKKDIHPHITYPKAYFQSETVLVKEGNLSKVLVPIKGGMGFIIMGPVKNLRKKEIRMLDELGRFLEFPLRDLVEEAEKGCERIDNGLQKSNRKVRMLSAKNYALYYGYGQVGMLSHFDLIIVEPKGHTRLEFKELREKKKVIFTYLSLLEVHPTEPIFQELSEDDFLYVNGQPLRNEAFGTYLVNLKSQKWMSYLLETVQHHLLGLEADGLFLDTIGDIECPTIPYSVKRKQLYAAINFLHVLKMLYPSHLIIQNNGLETVCLETAPYIDGICWENPPLSLHGSKEWADLIVQRLTFLKNEFQLKVFLLLEETVEKERKSYTSAQVVAEENGFLLYNAPKDYLKLKRNDSL